MKFGAHGLTNEFGTVLLANHGVNTIQDVAWKADNCGGHVKWWSTHNGKNKRYRKNVKRGLFELNDIVN